MEGTRRRTKKKKKKELRVASVLQMLMLMCGNNAESLRHNLKSH
jgi:hypothetical protein